MLRFSPFFAGVLLCCACSTPAVEDFGFDAGPDIPDVKLSFGKPDAVGNSPDGAVKSDADARVEAATADAAKPDAEPDAATDAAADAEVDAAAATDAQSDAAVTADVQPEQDSGVKPDIPGCVPKPETCDGVDDDCNGLTDDSCDDGEPCTVNDACAGLGDCVGTLMDCNDGNACTADTCTGGTCDHPVYPCNDNNPCTADACDPASGCTHPPLTDGCDDGNPCTINDNCSTGTCAGTPDTCDDANPCTTDACAATGCSHVNNTAACDDGNPCTPNDVCTAGACVGSGNPCDDGNACTDDTCDGGTCGHVNNTAACSDGDGCTSGDACAGGSCVGGSPTNCDDGLTCTTDACSAGACTHADTCGANMKCDEASNACITTGCALPANACANGNQNRQDCGGARIIGRSAAKTSGGYKVSNASTCDSLNYFQWWNACSDGGYDHSYRIFLRKGETISMNYSGSGDTSCDYGGDGSNTSIELKVIQAASGCGDPGSNDCPNYAQCWWAESKESYTAPAEGWYLIIADSDDNFGGPGLFYSLTVKLTAATCQVAGCECP